MEDVLASSIGLARAITSLDLAAVAWLDAAAALRRAQQPVTPITLLMRVTDTLVHQTDALNTHGDRELRALGGDPPTEPVKIPS